MVRPSFIKSLDIDGDNKLTVKARLVEIFWYNRPMIFFRRLGRFIQRLPKWLKLCWKTENWDYESKSKCLKTTQHIADKILLLRRAKRFSQEKLAESLNT